MTRNGHSQTDKSARPGVTVINMHRTVAAAVGQRQRLYSGVRVINYPVYKAASLNLSH
jgi:hypothetical protein